MMAIHVLRKWLFSQLHTWGEERTVAHHAETAYCFRYYGVHTPVKRKVFFQGKEAYFIPLTSFTVIMYVWSGYIFFYNSTMNIDAKSLLKWRAWKV
jgi:hypothetical protein